MTTADVYLQFVQMLLNGGQLNGKRLLAPRTAEVMRTANQEIRPDFENIVMQAMLGPAAVESRDRVN